MRRYKKSFVDSQQYEAKASLLNRLKDIDLQKQIHLKYR
jgi:hypothetical protein